MSPVTLELDLIVVHEAVLVTQAPEKLSMFLIQVRLKMCRIFYNKQQVVSKLRKPRGASKECCSSADPFSDLKTNIFARIIIEHKILFYFLKSHFFSRIFFFHV